MGFTNKARITERYVSGDANLRDLAQAANGKWRTTGEATEGRVRLKGIGLKGIGSVLKGFQDCLIRPYTPRMKAGLSVTPISEVQNPANGKDRFA